MAGMKKAGTIFSFLIVCSWGSPAHSQSYTQDEYIDMISHYVDRVSNIYDGTWAYTYTTTDHIDADSLTRRVDPSQPFLQSDLIIAEDGGPPSTERLERHERRMQRRLRRREEASQDSSLVEDEREREGSEKERFMALIIRDSIRLVARDGDLHTIEFRGMEEDRKKIYEHVVGRLVLDTRQEYIKELQVRVTEPFSPFFIIRINDGYFSLRFELHNGEPVQQDATWQLDGHILYIRDLDRDEELKWFDIAKVLPEAAS
ncbi:MAG: hypothetical protein P8M72_02350 [Gammaproteobacteria bacterium]|nr:hypothetical protein [Gammaproteobacteria bacterium]